MRRNLLYLYFEAWFQYPTNGSISVLRPILILIRSIQLVFIYVSQALVEANFLLC